MVHRVRVDTLDAVTAIEKILRKDTGDEAFPHSALSLKRQMDGGTIRVIRIVIHFEHKLRVLLTIDLFSRSLQSFQDIRNAFSKESGIVEIRWLVIALDCLQANQG